MATAERAAGTGTSYYSQGTTNHANNDTTQTMMGDGSQQQQQQGWFQGSTTATANTNTNNINNAPNMYPSNPNFNVASATNIINNNNTAPSPYNQPIQQQQPQQSQQQPHQQQPQQQPYQPQQNGFFSGSMDNNATATTTNNMNGFMNPSTTNNTTSNTNSMSTSTYIYNPDDFADEPPLLEELGINISHIQTKSLAVILPMKYAKQTINENLIMDDTDMAGPIVFGVTLALELLLAGRIHFGYIYGLGLFGCFATTLIINLMSPNTAISIWTVVSILGYSLLPVNMLAALNVLYRIRLMGDLGVVLGMITIAWCTVSSTRLFERGCGLRDQRFLIGYPNALLYSAFVLLTIF